MPEPMKYVTPAQLEALKDAINAAGGLGGGGTGEVPALSTADLDNLMGL